MNEREVIRLISGRFERSEKQRNEPFTCDAELVELGGEVWGVTLDEFSPEEDRFLGEPEQIGANLATATLSDLYAAGVVPRFFLHALSLPEDTSPEFVERLARGIASRLIEADCAFLGGDSGRGPTWRYTGYAMGVAPRNRPLTRLVPEGPQTLWVTGRLGDANVAAFRGESTPSFELRSKEAELAREHATACIDTSSGFLDAVWCLHEVNPGREFRLDVDRLPLDPALDAFSRETSIPAGAALLGGAGEYELLFTTPADLAGSAEDALRSAGATPVGAVGAEGEGPVVLRREGRAVGVVGAAPPCPRGAGSVENHIREVIVAAGALFGEAWEGGRS
ncbi:MAG: thiamine-phosphate kinase [Planctomycetota bacterium]|jgi:thiamine-monophosphate kinase